MTTTPLRRVREHGTIDLDGDRRALERAGWRTFLEYHENHVRGRDGRLLRVEPSWTAEAERARGRVVVVAASAATAAEAWARLRLAIADDAAPPDLLRSGAA